MVEFSTRKLEMIEGSTSKLTLSLSFQAAHAVKFIIILLVLSLHRPALSHEGFAIAPPATMLRSTSLDSKNVEFAKTSAAYRIQII